MFNIKLFYGLQKSQYIGSSCESLCDGGTSSIKLQPLHFLICFKIEAVGLKHLLQGRPLIESTISKPIKLQCGHFVKAARPLN